jgi:saccharopine dehydrogenase (NAD+, L-lysine-forming)
MVYGANGFTGRALAKLAEQTGQRPVLAGRSVARILPLAEELGLDHVIVDPVDTSGLHAALAGVTVVANCAGPFSQTAGPLVDACLATTTHYVDITGEVDVFESIYARAAEAERAGVVLLPGAGFDVVPTDCLAAILAAKLPEATELELAFTLSGGFSPGTVKTALEGIGVGGRARVDGELQSVPLAHRQTIAEFSSGPRQVTAIPWGDLSSAYRTTGIPNITTYTLLPGSDLINRSQQFLGPLLRMPAVQRAGMSLVDRWITGPSEERQANSKRCEVWGRVSGPGKHYASGTVSTPAGQLFTVDAVLHAVRRLLGGEVSAGAHTPSSAFGSDFLADLDDVTVGRISTR